MVDAAWEVREIGSSGALRSTHRVEAAGDDLV